MPAIKDNLMDENWRDQSVSISLHVQQRVFWPFSQDYCLDIVGFNSCRIVMEYPTFLLIIMIVKVLTMVGRLSFLCLKVKKLFC